MSMEVSDVPADTSQVSENASEDAQVEQSMIASSSTNDVNATTEAAITESNEPGTQGMLHDPATAGMGLLDTAKQTSDENVKPVDQKPEQPAPEALSEANLEPVESSTHDTRHEEEHLSQIKPGQISQVSAAAAQREPSPVPVKRDPNVDYSAGKKIFIAGLPDDTRIDDLEDCFGRIGKVIHVELKRTFGFVVRFASSIPSTLVLPVELQFSLNLTNLTPHRNSILPTRPMTPSSNTIKAPS